MLKHVNIWFIELCYIVFIAPKPGYGLAPRAATLPVSGMYGGPLDLDYVSLML
jgi:hypothetical protein